MSAATVKRQREMGQIGTQQTVRGALGKKEAAPSSTPSAPRRATGIDWRSACPAIRRTEITHRGLSGAK
jgi:hypothetical protein